MARHGDVVVATFSITFDDGYADNFINSERFRRRARCRLPTLWRPHIRRIGESQDVRAGEYGFASNTCDQIRVLRHFGYEIDRHTRNHADCGVTKSPAFGLPVWINHLRSGVTNGFRRFSPVRRDLCNGRAMKKRLRFDLDLCVPLEERLDFAKRIAPVKHFSFRL